MTPIHPTRRTALARMSAPLLAATAWLSAPRDAWAVDVGAPAPAIDLAGIDGSRVSLGALRGKVVFVDFWASWCVPCRFSFPWLNAMQARHGARGFQVLGVNVDRQRAAADAFLRQLPATFPVGFDPAGDVPRSYGVKAMPTSLLIDATGVVVLRHEGFRDDDRADLESAIDRAVNRVVAGAAR